MTAICQKKSAEISVREEIEGHPAWYGEIAGLSAEKAVRGRVPYIYLLRAGEYDSHYYVTFVASDGSVRHQPFVISFSGNNEWFYENGGNGGPYMHGESIEDVIHKIIHCEREQCIPLVRLDIR